MGRKPRAKMPIEQRAKQFAPFQAVDGLSAALRRAEEEHRRALESSGEVREHVITDNEPVQVSDDKFIP